MPRSSRRTQLPTLIDLAAAAEVSFKTASLSLRGHPSVTQETTRHVQETAVRIGYASTRDRRHVLGLIVPHVAHRSYTDIMSFVRTVAYAYGHILLSAKSGGEPDVERRRIEEFSRRGVDGTTYCSSPVAGGS